MNFIDTLILALLFWTTWQIEMIALILSPDFRTFIYLSFAICILVAMGLNKTSVIKE